MGIPKILNILGSKIESPNCFTVFDTKMGIPFFFFDNF